MFSINQNIPSVQKQIGKQLTKSDSDDFFNLLTSPELFEITEDLLPDYRERTFPPTETLSMFLAQVINSNSSCQKAVTDAAMKRLISGLDNCSLATGGYCKARQRIPLKLVKTLAQQSAKLIEEHVPSAWKFKARNVKLIDGTTVCMPDTKANQEIYPQSLSQKKV